MMAPIICANCNGRGYVCYTGENFSSSVTCEMCKGNGTLGEIDMVSIPIQEYDELLEYKRMYEDLCK